jgi:hypothetical protein
VVFVASGAGGAPATVVQRCSLAWRLVPNPTGGNLLDVAALSASDVWAVGVQRRAEDEGPIPLIEHWDGRSWQVVPSPPIIGGLTSVAAVSPTDVWAVGWTASRIVNGVVEEEVPLIEHWDGATWRVVLTGAPTDTLEAVSAVSATRVWAVGQTEPGQTVYGHVLRWNGSQWSDAHPRRTVRGTFFGVAALADNDVWVVGLSPIVHWDGRRWKTFRAPTKRGFAGYELTGVASVSRRNAWAVGRGGGLEPRYGVILRWNGGRWKLAAVWRGRPLSDVDVVSARNIWAVGSRELRRDILVPIVAHWNGRRWRTTRVVAPPEAEELLALAAVSSRDIWAMIAHYACA